MRLQFVIAAVLGLMSIANAQAPATRELNLKGGRFKPLTYDQLTPEQKAMVGDLATGANAATTCTGSARASSGCRRC